MLDIDELEKRLDSNKKAMEYFNLAIPLIKKGMEEIAASGSTNVDASVINKHLSSLFSELGYSVTDIKAEFDNMIKKAIGETEEFEITKIVILTKPQYERGEYDENGAHFING